MSDFNKIDRPVERDRFDDFKANVAAQIEYRRAYNELAATDPARALTLPHPDDKDTDVAAALEALRGLGGSLTTDGRVDLKS